MMKGSDTRQPKSQEKKGPRARVKESTINVSANELTKVTLYVRPDQIIGIEAIQLQERKRTGMRTDKSRLVQEALDLLINKYKPPQ
jgi:hypothetical protein